MDGFSSGTGPFDCWEFSSEVLFQESLGPIFSPPHEKFTILFFPFSSSFSLKVFVDPLACLLSIYISFPSLLLY